MNTFLVGKTGAKSFDTKPPVMHKLRRSCQHVIDRAARRFAAVGGLGLDGF